MRFGTSLQSRPASQSLKDLRYRLPFGVKGTLRSLRRRRLQTPGQARNALSFLVNERLRHGPFFTTCFRQILARLGRSRDCKSMLREIHRFPPDYSLRTRYQTGEHGVHARTLGIIQWSISLRSHNNGTWPQSFGHFKRSSSPSARTVSLNPAHLKPLLRTLIVDNEFRFSPSTEFETLPARNDDRSSEHR
jgi:hypothetical protein